MRILFTLLFMLTMCGLANAQTVTFTATHPTTREDASALSLTEIDYYVVGCNSASEMGPFSEWTFTVTRDAMATGHAEVAPKDDDWWCVAMTVDTGGLVSGHSVVGITRWSSPPSPPGSLQLSCTANCNTTINFSINTAP